MALTCPNAGEDALLDMMLSDASPNNQVLRLYSAVSPAISETSVAGDFTECTFTGYSSKTLTRATWNAASASSKTYPQQTWSPTSAQTVVGYYVTEAVTGTLLWAEAFAGGPYNVDNGDTIQLDIAVTLD